MWESILNTISRLLSSFSRLGLTVIEFLENEELNTWLNRLVPGQNFTTYEILFGGAIGAILIVGIYNWITAMIVPG